MKLERTLFFVKPDCDNPFIDKATALEIVAFLEDKLGENGGVFERIVGIRTQAVPEEFYREFYEHVEESDPDLLDAMSKEFAEKSLAIFIYEGPGIIQRVKDITGPTLYKDNLGKNTIRKVFGSPDMSYRTVVHASDNKGIKHDLYVLKKYKIISRQI